MRISLSDAKDAKDAKDVARECNYYAVGYVESATSVSDSKTRSEEPPGISAVSLGATGIVHDRRAFGGSNLGHNDAGATRIQAGQYSEISSGSFPEPLTTPGRGAVRP